jgi:predicted lipid carrier protein YhbT
MDEVVNDPLFQDKLEEAELRKVRMPVSCLRLFILVSPSQGRIKVMVLYELGILCLP